MDDLAVYLGFKKSEKKPEKKEMIVAHIGTRT